MDSDFSFMDFDLFEVARNECFPILNIALDNLELYNFNIDAQDTLHGNTLLHYAAFSGNTETTVKLIALSAYTNILNKRGETALHLACLKGHTNVVKLLVEYGSKLNVADFHGDTPLFKSIEGENKLLTKFLFAQEDTNINISNKFGERLIHMAVKYNDIYLVEILLDSGEDPNITTNSGETPLQLAVRFAELNILNLLIKRQGDLNVKDNQNCTLLHLAVKENREAICEQLLIEGLDVNSKDINGSTALHIAVEMNLISVVQLLLKHKADINNSDLDEYTPLHVAAKIKDGFDVLENLVKNNAKVDAVTVHGDLPLHVAAAVGNTKAFIFLYSKRYINCLNKAALTPIQIAEHNGYSSLVQLIQEQDKLVNPLPPPKIPVLKILHAVKKRTCT